MNQQQQEPIVTLNLPVSMVNLIVDTMARAQLAWMQANPVIVAIQTQVQAAHENAQAAQQQQQLSAEQANRAAEAAQAKAAREAAKAARKAGAAPRRGRKADGATAGLPTAAGLPTVATQGETFLG